LKQIGAPVGDGCDSANHRRKNKELVTAFYELAINQKNQEGLGYVSQDQWT
jgi:hypothetical protein